MALAGISSRPAICENRRNMNEKLKLQLAKLEPPKLSGNQGQFIELDADNEKTISRSHLFLSRFGREIKRDIHPMPKTLQEWKIDVERKMKVKRDEGIAKREQLYRIEKEEFDKNNKLSSSSEDEEEEEEDEESDENELENEEKDLEEPENDEELNLEQKIETKEAEKEQKLQNLTKIREDLDLEKDAKSEEGTEEEILQLLTNPFRNSDVISCTNDDVISSKDDVIPETNEDVILATNDDVIPCTSSYPDLFTSNPQSSSYNSQGNNAPAIFDDENAIDCFPLKNDHRLQAELGMEKNITSQEAEEEVLNLLTNPFGRDEEDDDEEEELIVLNRRKHRQPSENSDSNRTRPNSVVFDEENALSLQNMPDETCSSEFDKNLNEENDQEEDQEAADDEQYSSDEEDEIKSLSRDQAADDDASEDEEMALARSLTKNKFVELNSYSRKIRREFLDVEAELSGSEIDSDHDEDIGSDEDAMELEEGDMDDLPSDDELREQVGKIHHKQMLDDDKRKLLLYKDAYLPDGDMHTDDFVRRFRWRRNEEDNVNLSENLQNDDANASDDAEEEHAQQESAKHLAENAYNFENFDNDENANDCKLFGFKKISVRRSTSIFVSTSFATNSQDDSDSLLMCSDQNSEIRQRDSFLSRQTSILSKIAFENGNSNGPSSSSGCFTSKSLYISEKSQSQSQTLAGTGENSHKFNEKKRKIAEKFKTDSKKPTNFAQSGSIFESLYD